MGDKGRISPLPMMQLQDRSKPGVDRDAGRNRRCPKLAHLQDDLRRAGIEPQAWLINNASRAVVPVAIVAPANAQQWLCGGTLSANNTPARLAVVPLLRDGASRHRQTAAIEFSPQDQA